jgi:hypothetical protein
MGNKELTMRLAILMLNKKLDTVKFQWDCLPTLGGEGVGEDVCDSYTAIVVDRYFEVCNRLNVGRRHLDTIVIWKRVEKAFD